MYCSKCGKEISDDSRVCSFCGEKIKDNNIENKPKNQNTKEKKKPIYKKAWFWILIVVILLVVIIGSGGDNSTNKNESLNSNNNNDKISENKQEKVITKVGETLTTKYFKITVESLNKSSGNSYNKPSTGNEFVQIILNIENISNEDFSVSSILMFDAYCDSYSVNESLSAQIVDNKISTMDGALAKGKKLRGQLAYELPKDWKELEVDVDLTTLKWSNDGKIKLKLQNQ